MEGCRKLRNRKVGAGTGSEEWRTRLEGHSDGKPVRNLGGSDYVRGRRIDYSY